MIPTSFRQSRVNQFWRASAAVLQQIRKNIAKCKRLPVRCFFLVGHPAISMPEIVYLFSQLLELRCSAFWGEYPGLLPTWTCCPGSPLPSHQPQHLRSLRQDPARLCCARQSSLLPIQGPGGCRKAEFCGVLDLLCFSRGHLLCSPAPFASLCRTGFNTLPCKTLN